MPRPLPDLIPFSNYSNWELYVEIIYKIYIDEIVNGNLHFSGLPIHYRFIPKTDGKGFGFWHLISEGKDEENRLPSMERCERIRWVKWILEESCSNKDIRWFETQRASSANIVLWNPAIHYAVILGRRTNYLLLLTAFPTTSGRERSLLNDWNNSSIKG
jgi:hypothetical protein